MTIALHHSRARGTSKVVLLGIANHDGDGGAWPSIATLAKYANVAHRNVQMAVRELERLGEVRVEVQAGGTGRTRDTQRPNLYHFMLRCPDDCDRTSQHRGAPPAASVRTGGDECVTGSPDDGITRGVTEASPEPSCEPSTEPSSGSDDPNTGLPAGSSAPRPTATKKPRKPTKRQIELWNADYVVLRDLCQEVGEDDPYSAWWTLRLEHGAVAPSRFMADLIDKGQWDGFVGRHGITTYERPTG